VATLLGVGNLIVAYNLPPERHDLAVVMMHRGYWMLGLLAGALVVFCFIMWLIDRF
jgi:hypothetical protein